MLYILLHEGAKRLLPAYVHAQVVIVSFSEVITRAGVRAANVRLVETCHHFDISYSYRT